ncbi:MAG TPA: rhodanese-like domain-containing protein [Bacteroidales bacterium]|nr:rhodanese-like domain-containing protein [Bacteroidales bacterium]
MKTKTCITFLSALVFAVFMAGCSGNNSNKNSNGKQDESSVTTNNKPVAVGEETTLLMKYLVDNGDYVRSKKYPSLIKASIVHDSLGTNQLVIDLRSPADYAEGHIKGAVNRKFSDLPAYFETGIKPFTYDRIVIVSDEGQLACYTTSLLRLMGYGNVYAMRWGMSAWNTSCADKGWLKDVSSKYELNLETSENPRPEATAMPVLNTGKKTGEDIASARFDILFKDGTDSLLITADKVFSDPQKYFIINLERKDKYEDGHIPGAVRYKPASTLGYVDEMASIPVDKPVVVYCSTGHNSAFATAYLRLMGYDARTLKCGNNSFMYSKMEKERTTLSWLPFTTAEVNDYKVVR